MAGPFDFLHIKGRTAGSSNELSFDVLDAARNDLGKKGKRSQKTLSIPKGSQGTYREVKGAATLSTAPEVVQRKKARKTHSARLWIIVVVAVAALVGTGVYVGTRYTQGEANFSGSFDSLIERFMELDERLVVIDGVMNDPFNEANAEQEEKLMEEFPSMIRDLNAIEAEASEMGVATMGANSSAMNSVKEAAEARKNMLAAAEGAFTVAKQVNGLAGQAEEAWSEILSGDDAARRAAVAANAAQTQEQTREALSLTEEARSTLNEACYSLKAIANQTPGTVFEAEVAYLQKRVASLDAAIETSNALLVGDQDKAATENDEYNNADRQAAQMANEMKALPKDQVISAFAVESDKWKAQYEEVRAEAVAADSDIRAHLNERRP